jgi:hypothetical protein
LVALSDFGHIEVHRVGVGNHKGPEIIEYSLVLKEVAALAGFFILKNENVVIAAQFTQESK